MSENKEPRLLFELCSGLLATAGARETVAYKVNSPFLQSLNLPAEPLLLSSKIRNRLVAGETIGLRDKLPQRLRDGSGADCFTTTAETSVW